MQLFELNAETGLPQFDPIVFEMKPFQELIKRDKTKDKSVAKTELAFIWLYKDYKSDFSSIADETKKLKEIFRIVSLPKGWKIDSKIQAAIDFYEEITKTTSTVLLEKMKKTINKLSDFLETIDFTETDSNGKLKHDMKKVVDTTNQVPRLLATLKEIEERVKEEQSNIEKEIRGNKNIATYEDGIDFDE